MVRTTGTYLFKMSYIYHQFSFSINAATSASVAEDIVMKDWSLFEDLSEYEKEEVNIKPATPPVAKKLYTTGTRAIVVHGVPCQ